MEDIMNKYGYFIYSQLSENRERLFLFIIELIISMIAIHILLTDFVGYYHRQEVYHNLKLGDDICFSVPKDFDYTYLENHSEIAWYSPNYKFITLSHIASSEEEPDYYLKATVYTKTQAEQIRYDVTGSWFDTTRTDSIAQAVIPSSLSNSLQIGKQYTMYSEEVKKNITFEVTGILKHNNVFLLPNDAYNQLITDNLYNEILLYDNYNSNYPCYKVKKQTVLLAKCKNPVNKAKTIETLQKENKVQNISDLSSVWDADKRFALGRLVTPGIIGGIIILLTIINLISASLLNIHSKERCYGILFLNGATKKQCFYTQVVIDCTPILIGLIFTEAALFFLERTGRQQYVSLEGFLASLAVCIFITLFSAYINMNKLYKKNVISMIERR